MDKSKMARFYGPPCISKASHQGDADLYNFATVPNQSQTYQLHSSWYKSGYKFYYSKIFTDCVVYLIRYASCICKHFSLGLFFCFYSYGKALRCSHALKSTKRCS